FIGVPSNHPAGPLPTTIDSARKVRITAKNDGFYGGFALAGAVLGPVTPAPPPDTRTTQQKLDDYASKGFPKGFRYKPDKIHDLNAFLGTARNTQSGVGVAGDASVSIITDTALAYINTPGNIKGTALDVVADNEALLVTVGGSVQYSRAGGNPKGGLA